MDINYWAILVCGIISMVLGSVWYGFLFQKTWMRINNITPEEVAKKDHVQNQVVPLYIISFVMTLFQAYVLSFYIHGWAAMPGIHHALLIWAAFLIPTAAAGTMWSGDSRRVMVTKFAIQAGYYLVLFVIFGAVLAAWK